MNRAAHPPPPGACTRRKLAVDDSLDPSQHGPSRRDPLLALVLVVVGGVAVVGNAWSLRGALLSLGWPRAAGTVIEAGIEIREDAEGTDYVPRIRYRFVVDRTPFEASRISFGQGPLFATRSYAESLVARYPAGRRVAVAYDPDAPFDAVLHPGPGAGGLVRSAVSVTILVAGMTILVRARKQPTAQPAPDA